MYREEDLVPRGFAAFAEREYGLLFYNDNNKDPCDSNHGETDAAKTALEKDNTLFLVAYCGISNGEKINSSLVRARNRACRGIG